MVETPSPAAQLAASDINLLGFMSYLLQKLNAPQPPAVQLVPISASSKYKWPSVNPRRDTDTKLTRAQIALDAGSCQNAHEWLPSRKYSLGIAAVRSAVGSAPRRRGSLVEEDSTQRVVD